MKKYEVEPLNYTDYSILSDALKHHLGQKKVQIGTYSLDLLCKLERNKQTLYNMPGEGEENDANS